MVGVGVGVGGGVGEDGGFEEMDELPPQEAISSVTTRSVSAEMIRGTLVQTGEFMASAYSPTVSRPRHEEQRRSTRRFDAGANSAGRLRADEDAVMSGC